MDAIKKIEQADGGLLYMVERDPLFAKASCLVTHPGQLTDMESVCWLNTNALFSYRVSEREAMLMWQGRARLVNQRHPTADRLMREVQRTPQKKRIHILALGDVGATLLLGLKLLGGDAVSTIGIYDARDGFAARYEQEMNQITEPFCYDALPIVEAVTKDTLFNCDMFLFCASAGVPAVGAAVEDVRMAQLAGNLRILKEYARMARDARFAGIFGVVSDPVDILCRYAFLESNRTEAGQYDHLGLLAEQIRGYGLGVMNARAAYHAGKEARFSSFLSEGRAYGPHGQGLVIANSIERYDDALSKELTSKTIEANLAVRALGFKPYIAPAISSGALSVLATLRGEWHYSAVALGGVYFGCRNRQTPYGLETEALPLEKSLYKRLKETEYMLKRQGEGL